MVDIDIDWLIDICGCQYESFSGFLDKTRKIVQRDDQDIKADFSNFCHMS